MLSSIFTFPFAIFALILTSSLPTSLGCKQRLTSRQLGGAASTTCTPWKGTFIDGTKYTSLNETSKNVWSANITNAQVALFNPTTSKLYLKAGPQSKEGETIFVLIAKSSKSESGQGHYAYVLEKGHDCTVNITGRGHRVSDTIHTTFKVKVSNSHA